VTEPGDRRLSRRGLLSIFGVGARTFGETLRQEAPNLGPGAPPSQRPRAERKLRPDADVVRASSDGQGGWIADLRPKPLAVGASAKITGPGLAEPLLAARVHERHVAIVGGECPGDGSDLLWLAFEDRVACPSCGGRWRLDGYPTRAPADSRLASFLVDDAAGFLRFRLV
jgi:hypothetical protein